MQDRFIVQKRERDKKGAFWCTHRIVEYDVYDTKTGRICITFGSSEVRKAYEACDIHNKVGEAPSYKIFKDANDRYHVCRLNVFHSICSGEYSPDFYMYKTADGLLYDRAYWPYRTDNRDYKNFLPFVDDKELEFGSETLERAKEILTQRKKLDNDAIEKAKMAEKTKTAVEVE